MRELLQADIIQTAWRGVVGVTATGGTIYVSILPHIEAWLRLSSLVLGIIVAMLTIVSIIRKWNRRNP